MTRENSDQFEYDVALSFAGEDRATVENFSRMLDSKNIKYFYDETESYDLWGKDLIAHLADVYENQARYCVMFISKHYPLKKWTNFERTHIQARAFVDPEEYILPIRLDDTEIPGLPVTIGHRDLRRHSMESIVNSLEQKLVKAKGQATTSPTSQDIRPPSLESAYSSFGSIPMPKRNKTFTQLQKDRFAKEALAFIKQYFQHALRGLESQDSDVQTDFTDINILEFECKIYVHENIKCGCRIWLGEPNTIYYSEEIRRFGQGNSYNDYLTVEDNGEELRLRISGMAISIVVDERSVPKEKAAEYLWRRLTSRL